MDNMTPCRERVEELRSLVRSQEDALHALEKAFSQEAEHLRRHDQARCLDALEARVAQEAAHIRHMETLASLGHNTATLFSGLPVFALGSLAAAALHTKEHSLSIGAKLATRSFTRTETFGTVVVAVGPKGIPDGVSVVSLSQYARELDMSESQVIAIVKERGYRLMTPEEFLSALDELKKRVLKEVLTLPAASARLLLKPPAKDAE